MAGGNAFTRSLSRLSRRKKKNRNLTADDEVAETSHAAQAPPLQLHTERAMEMTEQHNPKPGFLNRNMDRLRRSIRHSLRRKKSPERGLGELMQGSSGQPKNELWQPDESAVRAGICSFSVKYLGAVEVFESRGMQVCEGALKLLRAQRRRPVKAVLYVSGDGLRVVDQENSRGLIVDQTIEKVSFCAPDRNNDSGFAYICRDGTTRRWMCHGFQASKESGERLSHAVGCAFAVCLEKKKKRDEENAPNVEKIVENALNPDWNDQPVASVSSASPPSSSAASTNGTSDMQRANAAYQSFRRQLTIPERLQDPQTAIVTQPPSAFDSINESCEENKVVPPSIAKPRPAANPNLFQRQGSLRAPESNTSFRRQFSLRPASSSFDTAPMRLGNNTLTLFNEPIYEGDEDSHGATSQQYQMNGLPPYSSNQPVPLTASSLYSIGNNGPSVSLLSYPQTNGFGVDSTRVPPQTAASNQAALASMPTNKQDQLTVNTNQKWTEVSSSSSSSSAPLSNRSKADDWLENALRQITISPTQQPQTPKGQSSGFTNLGSHYSAMPGSSGISQSMSVDSQLSAAQPIQSQPAPSIAPPAIPARPAVSNIENRAPRRPIPASEPPTSQSIIDKSSEVDRFGHPIRWDSPLNGTVEWERTPEKIRSSDDPFDVQWSKMALATHNPFTAETNHVNV